MQKSRREKHDQNASPAEAVVRRPTALEEAATMNNLSGKMGMGA
jgi:hypothetical protein